MLIKLLTKVFGSRNDRTLRRMRKVVNIINAMEPEIEKLSDEELKGKTAEFRARLEKGEVLENLIPEAFAVVREASKRVFGMRHFDVQLLGGMVLNERCIAEMRTGEGKTLTATLPAYLNALTGKGVHVVTVNDYLAQRDAENNRPLFEFLGLTVGINLPGMPAPAKREAYAADITYGTNNEYGFDYLRDNMAFSPEERVQRKLHYALVDEVDSILIDEARTPLIISGPAEDSSEMYKRVNKIIPHLIRQEKEDSETFQGEGHFSVDEKSRQVNLTERGLVLIEELLVKEGIMDEGESLYSPANIMLIASMNPCPCGYYNHPTKECNCPPGEVQKYLSKISGPLLDRIDIHIEVIPVELDKITNPSDSEASSVVRTRVIAARAIQTKRFQSYPGIYCNAQMTSPLLKKYCPLDDKCVALLKIAMQRFGLSARAYDRIIKLSRTIADLDHNEKITPQYIAEAIQYRSLDKDGWGR